MSFLYNSFLIEHSCCNVKWFFQQFCDQVFASEASLNHFRQGIVLHGGGGNGENIARMSKMSGKADKDGFVTVYSYGSGRFKERLLTWNAGNCCGYTLDQNIDDVSLIRALIQELERNLRIDPKRIYATGISNGGKMSHLLACELSDKIAAIGYGELNPGEHSVLFNATGLPNGVYFYRFVTAGSTLVKSMVLLKGMMQIFGRTAFSTARFFLTSFWFRTTNFARP